MPDFCHLHCHTQYSLLDGAAGIDTLLGRAKEKGIPSVAITDHGNLYGVPEFYTTAKDKGVEPIIGCEFYVTPSGIDDQRDRTRYHQVLLAKDETGYQNLMKLSSKSFTEGFYYKPRIDHDLIAKHSEGLVATTCCLQGEVLQTILNEGEEKAREIFEWYLGVFGDDYYIEIQDHDIDDQHTCNEVLLQWAKEYDVEVVATNDVHYVEQGDAAAQDVLLCLQTGKDYNDPNRMRFENDQFYLKGAEEMTEALTGIPGEFQREALVTTNKIADKCQFELPMGDLLMPHYPIPDEFDGMDDYLRHLTFERATERYGEPLPQHVVDRLNHELGIIKEMGYSGYFLIVQDFTEAARELDVRVGPGRGSAAGSCVSYCLGITNVDPLEYDLLFERFLNPERVSMPDIDIDFDDRGRSKVIDYVVKKYGRENVCQIITFGTMGAKTAIRDVARVLDISLDEADRIAKMIPDGVGVDLDQAKQEVPEFRQLKQSEDPQVRKMMHYAEVLEGSARHTGVHAAGVIIAPGKVSDYVPVSVSKSKGEKVVTTQYDGDWVEEFGLLKMDFLGLKTLTVINDALELIEDNHGVEIDIQEIPLDDEKTFELFQRGETVSIFQFESTGMREWMRKLQPTELDDLIAMNALYRPGPMDHIPTYIARKHGEEPVEYPHPMLEDILEPTYGIPVYQEQVMQMAQKMGDFSLGKADILRRCVTGDTHVVNADTGERVRVDQVEPGMSILTMDDRYGLTKTTVTERLHNGRKPVYQVTTRSGRTIKLTANHPLRTVDGWKHLSDLSEGDAIAVPATLPAHGTDMPDSARVTALAYLLGDGQTMDSQGRAVARFYNSDPALLADYETAVASLGGQTKRYEHPTSSVQTITARGAERGHNPITALVRETDLVGRAEEKHFPKEVFRYDADALALFLGRLFSTDGSVEKTRLSYSSSSPALIDDLAHALLRLGIPTVRRHRTTTHRDNQELIITDQKDIVRFADVVGPHVVGAKQDALAVLRAQALARQRSHSIYNVPAAVTHAVRRAKYASGRTWREGGDQVGMPGNTLSSGLNFKAPARKLSRHRLEALGRAFDSPGLVDMATGDVLWDPIVDIEPVGEAEVYDLAVPPHANFVASDVVIHNSMGKKKVKIMNRMKGEFVQGAREKGVDDQTIENVWEMMAKFAGYGFNKCVTGDTEIVDTKTGRRIPVIDIVEGRETNVTVASLDEDGQKIVERRVVDAFSSGVAQTYQVRTKTGRQIRATGNHPVYTPDGWVHVSDLQSGDRVAVPRKHPHHASLTMEQHELVVLAYAISEGNLCHPSGFYVYTTSNEELQDYCEHLRRFENSEATIDWSKPAASVYAKRADVSEPSQAVELIDDLGLSGKSATTKFVPAPIFRLSSDQLALFLGRLWTGDGGIDPVGGHICYSTSSDRLARDVQHLLLRLGIPSTTHEKTFKYRDQERLGYVVRVSSKAVEAFARIIGPHLIGKRRRDLSAMLDTEIGNGRMTHDVVPMAVLPVLREAVRAAAGSRGQSMKAFMRNRGMSPRLLNRDRRKKGFARSTVAALAEATNHEKLQTWAESEIYWDEVAAVEEDAVEEVYDLTVEGTHNFVANDLIVHNSHAAAYSIVAYQTAYLKAHYPAEFMAAAMTNDMGNNDKLSVVLEEARSMGLEILPPSINRSERYFTVDDGAIRFGLAAVKGAGTSAIDAIVNNREENGPFDTIWELTRELDLRTAGKRTLESLAQAGAMDELEGHRAQLIEAVDAAVRYGQKVQADKAAGQNSLFGGDDFGASEMEPNLPRTEPWPKAKKLKSEHEVIGFYVSGHPLDEFRAEADAFATAHFGDTEAIEEIVQNAGGDGRSRGPVRTFCGIITEVNRHTTKSGKPIAFASIEDFTGQGELVCFSTVLDRIQPYLEVDNVVLVQGNVELRGGTVKVIAKDVMPMWKVRDQMVKSIVLNVDATQIQTEAMREFKQLCEANRGHCKLYFDIDAPELHQSQRVRSRSVVIDPTSEVMKEMKRLFGRENIRLQGEA